MAGCHQKWLNDRKVLLLKYLREVLYQMGVHCLKEVGGVGWFSLNLFNTKMTPDLLVNKAIRESLIGGLFTGPGTGPQEAAVFRPPWSWAAPQALWRLCSFLPSLCLFSVWSVFIPSLLPPCLSLFHSSFSSCSLLSQDHFFSPLISIPKPPCISPQFKCY